MIWVPHLESWVCEDCLITGYLSLGMKNKSNNGSYGVGLFNTSILKAVIACERN